MKPAILTLLAANCVFGGDAFAEDLNCLTERERARAELYACLQQQAHAALERLYSGIIPTHASRAQYG